MSFDEPFALLGLLVVPTLVAMYVLRRRRHTEYAARFGTPALLPNVVTATPGWRRHLPLAVLLAGLAALVVGVARPHATVSVKREEATVILAVDVSRSMKAQDVRPSRLEAARSAAEAFLAKIPSKFRVGVVAFASRASVGVPPTEDRALVLDALKALRPGEGTALGDAVALSVRIGQKQRSGDGATPPTAVLVISDGAQMGGRTPIEKAIQMARLHRVPVYAIVLGTPKGYVQETLKGGYRIVIPVPPAPETLRTVAQATGGLFFTARNDTRLRQVYEKLGSRLGHRQQSREITDVFAAGSLALLLTGGGLSAFWFRRIFP
jgi:Ca-activated chloride channel family protein